MAVMMTGTKSHLSMNTCKGFTLIEIMITLAISGIIMAAIYSAYISQQRTYLAQEQVVEMQQNLRAALDMLARETRMAGYDPTGAAGASFTTASAGQMSFTQDITDNAGTGDGDGDFVDDDGDLVDDGEVIDYGFSVADDAGRDGIPDADADGDGIPDPVALCRQNGGGYQSIAENIQAIEFRYLDSGGAVTATLSDIRSVQISILARAGQPDPDFTNNMTYTPASGVAWDLNGAAFGSAPNDHFRRRLLITTVQCRNMGL
jgi:type IV pilus assembly protein PilW